jgi:hypothetical protein
VIRENNILFDVNIHDMEDKVFCLEYMNFVHQGGKITTRNMYKYTVDSGVSAYKKYTMKKYKTGFDACERILDLDCVKQYPEIREIQEGICVKHCIQIARGFVRNNEDVVFYQQAAKKYKKSFLKSPYFSIKQKLGFYVFEFFPVLLKYI